MDQAAEGGDHPVHEEARRASYPLHPVGVIHSTLEARAEAPKQGREGEVRVRVGAETATVSADAAVLAPAGQDHGVENPGPARAALLVFMAPHP